MDILQQQICQDVALLLNKFKSAMLYIAEEQKITRMQLFALYAISSQGELAMGKTADVLHCDPSNITGLVDRLVSQGLITRQECTHDRRAKILQLTEKGKAIVTALEDTLPAKLGCDQLTKEEIESFHAITQKICAD